MGLLSFLIEYGVYIAGMKQDSECVILTEINTFPRALTGLQLMIVEILILWTKRDNMGGV